MSNTKPGSIIIDRNDRKWVVVERTHEDACVLCDKHVWDAISTAKATGSTGGASATQERTYGKTKTSHSATVKVHKVSDGVIDSFDTKAINNWSKANRPDIISRVSRANSTWIEVTAEDFAKLIGHPDYQEGR